MGDCHGGVCVRGAWRRGQVRRRGFYEGRGWQLNEGGCHGLALQWAGAGMLADQMTDHNAPFLSRIRALAGPPHASTLPERSQ